MCFFRIDRVLWQYNQDYGITEVTIPHGITRISEFAFYSCTDLISIIIPDSVITIGEQAFCGCESLINITIPNNVTELRTATFCCCKSLKHVNLSSNITRIYDACFYNCNNLKSITLPESLQEIDESTFDLNYIKNINVFSYRVFSLLKGKLQLIALASVIKNYYTGKIEYIEEDMHKFNTSIYKNKNELLKMALRDEELLHIIVYDMNEFMSHRELCKFTDNLISQNKFEELSNEVKAMLLEYSNIIRLSNINNSKQLYGLNNLDNFNSNEKDTGIQFTKR